MNKLQNCKIQDLREAIQKKQKENLAKTGSQEPNLINNPNQNFSIQFESNKNHLIFLLDISPSMFKYAQNSKALHIQSIEIILKSILDVNLLYFPSFFFIFSFKKTESFPRFQAKTHKKKINVAIT